MEVGVGGGGRKETCGRVGGGGRKETCGRGDEVGRDGGEWERLHGLTDKSLVGADGGEGQVAHPPPDDQGQDDVHRTKHTHQDKTNLLQWN